MVGLMIRITAFLIIVPNSLFSAKINAVDTIHSFTVSNIFSIKKEIPLLPSDKIFQFHSEIKNNYIHNENPKPDSSETSTGTSTGTSTETFTEISRDSYYPQIPERTFVENCSSPYDFCFQKNNLKFDNQLFFPKKLKLTDQKSIESTYLNPNIIVLPPPPIKKIWEKIKEKLALFAKKIKKIRLPSWGSFRWWMRIKWREFRRWSKNSRSRFTVWGIYIAFFGICLLFCSLIAMLLTPSAVLFFLITGILAFLGGLLTFFINLISYEPKGRNKKRRVPLHKY